MAREAVRLASLCVRSRPRHRRRFSMLRGKPAPPLSPAELARDLANRRRLGMPTPPGSRDRVRRGPNRQATSRTHGAAVPAKSARQLDPAQRLVDPLLAELDPTHQPKPAAKAVEVAATPVVAEQVAESAAMLLAIREWLR